MIRRIWFRAAAIVLLAIIASVLIFRPFSRMSPDEIYAHYYHPFRKNDRVLEMARNDNDFLFAVEVYEAGDFERAAVLFEMLADSGGLGDWPMFYAGCSYMSMNLSDRAVEIFQNLIMNGEPAVVSHSRWNLALIHLRRGQTDLALSQLEVLREDPLYRKDARRILRFVQ
jgi:hypothetical protein